MRFKDLIQSIRLYIKVLRYSWFWAFRSHFYHNRYRWVILYRGIVQRRPDHDLEYYYPGDVSLLVVVNLIVHWFATEYPAKVITKFHELKDTLNMTQTTIERFERHFKLWRYLHLCDEE